MREYFTAYQDTKKILEDLKDPEVIKHIQSSLDFMRTKMFKSNEYLDSILEKEAEDVTPQDLHDILCKFGDPDNHHSWWSLVTVHRRHISSYIHGMYSFNEPCIEISEDSIHYTAKIAKAGHVYDPDRSGSYDFRELCFMKSSRLLIVKSILNCYKFYKLNSKLSNELRNFHCNWNVDHDDFWNSLLSWILKFKNDLIRKVNFDESSLTAENLNLLKSKIASDKFNLEGIKKAS